VLYRRGCWSLSGEWGARDTEKEEYERGRLLKRTTPPIPKFAERGVPDEKNRHLRGGERYKQGHESGESGAK